ncbi:MAG: ABC-F family ATP-binding cassette domain-containing protein [Candidatus Wildermuthbacteria bacterium]|nr:ABC-F family ATP-binding cassette domain-containing protein [Candidatus Wildermuthbacteria bacterium]
MGEVIIRFNAVSFGYGHNKPVLNTADFVLRRGAKFALMGQNGAGKSTIFRLIAGELEPEEGAIHKAKNLSIAVSRQIISRDQLQLTVREFFEKCFSQPSFAKASAGLGKIYDIDPKIDKVLEVVNLHAPHDRIVGSFSGGQQARLLLASALIQDPDVLLLDEPTNNLDKAGIAHLTKFLVEYQKTCIVISHDANFLNAFTQGVLYLDIFTHKTEQYAGNYMDLVEEISARIEKENRKNAQLAKQIQENKDKANFFANKGGQMRLVAKRMREKAEEMEEAKVDVRKEDRTIRPFIIPSQSDIGGEILSITSFSVMKNHKPVSKKTNISMRKTEHLLISGPNGIGKSTLLETLAGGKAKGAVIAPGVRVGYYRQDFSTLDFEDTVYDSLSKVSESGSEEHLRSTAAGFLITNDLLYAKIGDLSEGQKGLVSFARLVLQKPGLLILDEPTNHINFRHIPVIAQALNKYDGAMILVSHVQSFVDQIRIDQILDLEK